MNVEDLADNLSGSGFANAGWTREQSSLMTSAVVVASSNYTVSTQHTSTLSTVYASHST